MVANTSLVSRSLTTRRGVVHFPAYVPVTTFGDTYPLDALIQPYLPRLAPALMVSFHYAQQMTTIPRLPLFVDSGGFASLFEKSKIVEARGLGTLEIEGSDGTNSWHPRDVLELQERIAEVAFTLDFPVSPNTSVAEAQRRQELTIANALWAIQNRRRADLKLYACVQAWDVKSARMCTKSYVGHGFDGLAIGGLVPRARTWDLVLGIVRAVREEIGPELPLHVFGLGKPETVTQLYAEGVDSVDSSAYVQLAAEGKLWGEPLPVFSEPTTTDRLHLALCNLATATGSTFPLSATSMRFRTQSLRKI